MDFLISPAWAEGAAVAQPNLLETLVPFLILIAVFYFFLIRPQSKRMKEHQQLLQSLAKGDEIVTNGGLVGKVTQVGENFVSVEIADNIEVKVQKHAIGSVLPKGTMKTL
jgi:preprotein translocase subunit YajC